MVRQVETEIIENSLRSACSEMEAAISRTAMSIIIREQHDFGVSILDAQGRVLMGSALSGEVLGEYARRTHVVPGDVVIFNDPFLSHGEISHLADTMLAVPVFSGQELVAWGVAWGHHMDVGASAPAGMPCSARSLFDEGIQIPPVRLYQAGQLNVALLEVLARNSRTPAMMRGDILALTAAGRLAAVRIEELLVRFGRDLVIKAWDMFFQRARDNVKKMIGLFPDVSIEFEDYMDDDGHSPHPLRLKLTTFRDGDRLVLDFAGTSSQTTGPVNFPLHPNLVKLTLYGMLCLSVGDLVGIDPILNPNSGVFDSIHVHLPEGSLLNPRYPCAVGLRHLTWCRLTDLLLGMLAQAFPDRVPAATNGSLNCYTLQGQGDFLCFEVTAAGSGARPFADGIDAFCVNTRLRNAPSEFVETAYPVLIEEYGLRSDSGGPGKFRGGNGVVRKVALREDAQLYFIDDRQRFCPWGIHGGRAGVPGDAFVLRASGETVQIPSKFDALELKSGDRFLLRTGGGGGWGNPFERDPELVLSDVRRGLVSVESARTQYGVAIREGELDFEKTTSLRQGQAGPRTWIDRGTERQVPAPNTISQVNLVPIP